MSPASAAAPPPPEVATPTDTPVALARSMAEVRPSTLLRLLARAASPEVVSFAIGMPAPELFPREAFAAACDRVLTGDPNALQYGMPSTRLKGHIVELMRRRGVECSPEEIFLTTGSQQAMDLLGRLLLDPGGVVLLEDKVFDGMRIALRTHVPRFITVPSHSGRGIDVGAVERLLHAGLRPAFLYLVPEGHNPLGISLGEETRRRLLELSAEFGVPILEDDAYGFLNYEQEPLAPLRAEDSERTFYLGSFSKIFAPSLRVGWIVAPRDLMPRLSALKHAADVDTASFAQRALADCLDHLDLPAHLEALRTTYRARRDAVLAALAAHLPGGTVAGDPGTPVLWHPPESGFYVWLELWPGADAGRVLEVALDHEGVAFTPGEVFSPGDGSARHCLRLSFAGLDEERIGEGIARLARALERVRDEEV